MPRHNPAIRALNDDTSAILCAKIDALGHKVQGELPLHLEHEVDRIADRVAELLDAGWERVRVVTDHGWLLLPGELPKVALPAYLTATKWPRCAVWNYR